MNIISTYTIDQAIEDGTIAKLADGDPAIYITTGVFELQGIGFDSKADDYLFGPRLVEAAREAYNDQPDICLDGGNDKEFYTFEWRNTKFFAAANEVNGITIMLPNEY